jgi:hypothetical protein
MAQHIKDNDIEPVLAVPVSKVMWALVFVVIYLAYVVLGFTDHVEKIIVERAEKLYEVIDHEMDDANDNYEASLDMIIKGSCPDAIKVFKATHICERR